LRIAFVTYEFPPDTGKGGIGTYTVQAADAMKQLGNDVYVFAGSNVRTTLEEHDGVLVQWIMCNSPYEFTEKVLHFFSIIHKLKPFDVIECPEIHANARLIKAAFSAIPLVVRLHGPNHLVESLKKTYTPFIVKVRFNVGAFRRGNFKLKWGSYNILKDNDYQFLKEANLITAPSKAMKDWAVKQWGFNDDKIVVIANPFKAPEALLNIPIEKEQSNKCVLFFGRLNVLKGLVNFTKASKFFLHKHTDWKLVVIGDDEGGPYREKSMRAWMKKELKSYEGSIAFLNGMPQDELYKYIGNADMVVLPSLFETFSYTCAEAMAAGKAIVGSKKGGMHDLLGNRDAGISVNPYSVKEIFNAMDLLATDNNLSNKLGNRARAIMQSSKYNTDVFLEMNETYKSLVQKKNTV
jgi:glycogen synthase